MIDGIEMKNYVYALSKFNKMFERLSNLKDITSNFIIECEIVTNYGENLLKRFSHITDEFSISDVRSKCSTLKTIVRMNKLS